MPQRDVLAAGAVVFRPGKRVLLVHRPKYDDWSFPKGKVDPGEHVTAAAVREVAEETGVHVRLGPPLSAQRYPNGDRMKSVAYWTGRAVGDDDVSGYLVNAEIDDVRWVDFDEAVELLTYPHDVDTLREAARRRRKTHALVVLRHGQARSRKAWRKDDRLRPLMAAGRLQAQHLVPVLAAYDVTRVVSSSSTRCVESVAPYADVTGWKLELEDALSEEAATAHEVLRVVDDLVHGDEGAVLCSHRPVLPAVFDALGLRDPDLEPGSMLVAHVRKGAVVATEIQSVR
ncbi:8-oxo-dGTP diphosphatase [Nocardioides ginsengisegetis]|uniref:8-oxo-dGTP diphosphatase n=1 Tax=Nocardioides ginsengisegetis TaxID=661491 RepID=A0A7W3IWB7_9ACTN|nr:NUDIX hydrolase [Nocardioides ginsengisegetis]MBA8801788.1 8-oxo-dGTP diphosphatase [Nocardioides ginsengisegetis]